MNNARTLLISFLATLLLGLQTGWAQEAELVLDNGGTHFSVVGDWPVSTAVGGYEGPNYQTHIPHGAVPGSLTVDNQDAGFSVTGEWPVSTAVTGYLGGNYRTHVANGPKPGTLLVDNGQGVASGIWSASTAVTGYQGSNYQHHVAGSGANSFVWPLAGSGQHRIYARWTSHPNRATNARYTVHHAGGDTVVTVNQQQNGGTWQLLGSFELDANSRVLLTDEANGYVIADAVMAEPVGAVTNAATWTLPIAATGTYRLHVRWTSHPNRATNARYTGRHAGGDTVVTVNQQQNGGTWQLLGSFELDANSRVLLTDEANGYVIADAVMAVPANAPAANSVTWTPTLAQAGRYDVSAKWTSHPNRATNARYTVRHAGGETAVMVNQRLNGGTWQPLGRFDLAPGQAAITLTDDADGYVIADAIQLTLAARQTAIYYIHPDHLGTPRVITDSASTVVWRWDNQEPFGNTPPNTDPQASGTAFPFNPRFPGQYADSESGTHYNYFRDYDPNIGRYVQSDPIGLRGGINTYSYVGGNPVSRIDPTGEFFFVALFGWSAATTAADAVVAAAAGMWMARPKNPPDAGPPGDWVQGPRRGRKYCPDGTPDYDIDKPHQGNDEWHVHEWPGGVREEPGRPVSPVPSPDNNSGE